MKVVAGPGGCGKTEFLEDPLKRISETALPDELKDIVHEGKRAMQLKNVWETKEGLPSELWIHVDFFNAVGKWRLKTSDLLEDLQAGLVGRWDRLSVLSEAEELHIVTLFVKREVTFRRFIDRHISEGKNPETIGTRRANVYGPDEVSEKLYSAMYDSWYAFTESLNAKSYWTVDGSEDQYFLHQGSCHVG
ncbi:MAG: hypothetical protein AAGJ31_02915 [Verrucomicrobiota bacterium]